MIKLFVIFFYSKYVRLIGYVCIVNESEFLDNGDFCMGWFVYFWVIVFFILIKVVLILFWYVGYKSMGIYVI